MDLIRHLQEYVAPNVFTPRAAYDGRKNMFSSITLQFPGGSDSAEVSFYPLHVTFLTKSVSLMSVLWIHNRKLQSPATPKAPKYTRLSSVRLLRSTQSKPMFSPASSEIDIGVECSLGICKVPNRMIMTYLQPSRYVVIGDLRSISQQVWVVAIQALNVVVRMQPSL